jgi:hypothetical protein
VKEELEKEYSRLEESLMDPSYRGGIDPSIVRRPPPRHPSVLLLLI